MPDHLPPYPEARPPEISDIKQFQDLFSFLQPVVSELCFANLFLFRQVHNYAITRFDNSLIIFGSGYDKLPYFLPPLSGNRGNSARKLLDAGNQLFGADELFIAEHLADKQYPVKPDRENDDYLYLRSELAELPGNRFHSKKNRINHFTSRYTYTVEPFSTVHLASALALLDKWEKLHNRAGNDSLDAEIAANREGLKLADKLGLSGVVVLTETGVSAFALGVRLNSTTTVCLFEKADPELEGVAQLVNREFSRCQPKEITYINRQQDLGKPGLREAKNSYHPVAMVRKFRVLPPIVM
jgi:hypothetical protein